MCPHCGQAVDSAADSALVRELLNRLTEQAMIIGALLTVLNANGSGNGTAPMAPSAASPDPFMSPEARKAAIERTGYGTRALAQKIRVDYSDLCAWRRDRGRKLAKGGASVKVERIERFLVQSVPVAKEARVSER